MKGSILQLATCLLLFSLNGITMENNLHPSRIMDFTNHAETITVYPPTPAQPQGPFYRRTRERDVDLTVVNDGPKAQGIEVSLQGRVFDLVGDPIAGARVEVWQASMFGSYNHPNDTNPAQRDSNFQGYGEDITDPSGEYGFITIVPGAYPASNTWARPPHIHVWVTLPNGNKLVTQLYFDGRSFSGPVCELSGQKIDGATINQLNNLDRILLNIEESLRPLLIVPFNNVEGNLVGTFDIYMPRS